MKNIGYQTRDYLDTSSKICGGSFGGTIDMDTVNRLVNAHFTVKVKPSGHAVFVDKKGREIWLSLTVYPANTIKGAEALSEWRKAKENKEKEEKEEIENLIGGLSPSEVIRRLRKEY